MAYTKIYSRVNWKNESESKSTPLGATLLNRMDDAVNKIDNRIIEMETIKLDRTTANSLVKDWHVEERTGVVTITKLDGSRIIFDLNLEKVPVDFELTPDGILIMRTDDGKEFTADIGALIPVFVFNDSPTISASRTETVRGSEVSFDVRDGSITGDKLRPDYLANIISHTQQAEQTANNLLTGAAEMAGQISRETQQMATDMINTMKQSIDGATDRAEQAAREAEADANEAATNAANSANSASSSAQSAARAETLVEEAYKIIKNSGNGGITDLLEVDLGYRFGELKQGNAGKNYTRDIVGVKDDSDKQVYYAVYGDSFLSRYKDGVWQDIALSYAHLIIEVVSLQKIATDGNRIYVLGYAINQNNSPVVFVIDNHDANSMDDIKAIAIETDEYSFGATVQPMIMDMTVNSYGDLILLTEYKTIQITPRDNTADSIVVVEDYYGNYGNMLTMEPLNSIAFDGNLNGVAVGRKHSSNEGYIRVYSDEIILNPYEEMVVGNAGFTKVIYCENCFLAFNTEGNVFKSEDGKDWGPIATLTDSNSQTPYNITDAAYNGQFVIALGINGELLVSDDLGYNWECLVNGQTEYRCLSESNGTFLLGKKEGGIDRYFIEIKTLSLTETVKLLYLDYLARQNP